MNLKDLTHFNQHQLNMKKNLFIFTDHNKLMIKNVLPFFLIIQTREYIFLLDTKQMLTSTSCIELFFFDHTVTYPRYIGNRPYYPFTSYPAPIRITPKSVTEAFESESENSILRIPSADCWKVHLHHSNSSLLNYLVLLSSEI